MRPNASCKGPNTSCSGLASSAEGPASRAVGRASRAAGTAYVIAPRGRDLDRDRPPESASRLKALVFLPALLALPQLAACVVQQDYVISADDLSRLQSLPPARGVVVPAERDSSRVYVDARALLNGERLPT